jgi:hypothetical protein
MANGVEAMTDDEWLSHYKKESARTRRRAAKALSPAVREALLEMARQYEDLAERMKKTLELGKDASLPHQSLGKPSIDTE